MYVYVYMCMYVCMYVCVWSMHAYGNLTKERHAMLDEIGMYVCICVYMYVCMYAYGLCMHMGI